MNLLRYLLLLPYNVWAWGTFFLLALVDVFLFASTLALVRKNPRRILYFWGYWYARIWGWLIFLRYQVKGRELIEKGKSYIITPNHRGLADLPIMVAALRYIPYRPLSKIELQRVPILGYLFKNVLVLIDRKSPESRKQGVETLKAMMAEEGANPLIFPEGTRNRTNSPLKEFYDGAFRIAIECQVPIVPMVMLNVDAITPPGSILIRPGTLHCHFLPPIPTLGLKLDDVQTLKQQVFDLMWQEVAAFRDKKLAFEKNH